MDGPSQPRHSVSYDFSPARALTFLASWMPTFDGAYELQASIDDQPPVRLQFELLTTGSHD